jgi:predicted GNAT family acetyltransferase
MDVTVQEAPDSHRYEAVTATGEVVGFVEYVDHRGVRVLFHTEVDDAYEGKGVGSTLAREVLDEALAAGRRLRITCPFLRSWIERHPDYAQLVKVG